MTATQWQSIIYQMQKKANDYPTKAILQQALKVYQEQRKRIEIQQAKLDGMSWSPKEWNN